MVQGGRARSNNDISILMDRISEKREKSVKLIDYEILLR